MDDRETFEHFLNINKKLDAIIQLLQQEQEEEEEENTTLTIKKKQEPK